MLGATDAGLRRCLTEGGFDRVRGSAESSAGQSADTRRAGKVRARSTAMDRQPGVA